jgi:hypothetical protein
VNFGCMQAWVSRPSILSVIFLSYLTRNDVPVPVLKRAVREILPLTCLFYIIFNSIVVIR